MKSLTIHNIDENLANEIKKIAQREGKSINQTVKTLLQKALESGSDKDMKKTEFLDLFGVWTEAHTIETGAVLITYDQHFKNIAGLRLWDYMK